MVSVEIEDEAAVKESPPVSLPACAGLPQRLAPGGGDRCMAEVS